MALYLGYTSVCVCVCVWGGGGRHLGLYPPSQKLLRAQVKKYHFPNK